MTPEDNKPRPPSDLDRYRAENLELKRQLSEYKRRVDDLLASTSWRMTGPVRALARWMKGLGVTGRDGSPNRGEGSDSIAPDQYQRWLRYHGNINPSLRAAMDTNIKTFTVRPLISVIMPSYNVELNWLGDAIASVREQIYPHFELCVSDDASTIGGTREFLEGQAALDARIRLKFRTTNGHISANSNSALALATGDYVALMDADDLLAPDALYWVAHAISSHPDVDLLFSDEDKIDVNDRCFDPYFKGAWNPALMLSQNAFSHLGVFRRSLVEKVGGFREGFEGAQDHDLVLRCAEATTPERIRHIPRILYHWRALPDSTAVSGYSKPYAWDAGRRAIEDHLKRKGIDGSIEPALAGYYQVVYEVPAPPPLVSVLVNSDLRSEPALRCLNSLVGSTTYPNLEVIILADRQGIEATRSIESISALLDHPRVRTVSHDTTSGRAMLINAAAMDARGSFLCLLDDSIEPLTTDWLDQLVARVSLEGVAIAGSMIYGQSDEVLHAGIIVGPGGAVGYPFRGTRRGSAGYFGRAALEQDYTCLSPACLVIQREAFRAAGGFDIDMPPPFDALDFCFRVRRSGLRAVWVPTARMRQHVSKDLKELRGNIDRLDAETSTRERCGLITDDPCYNPNLSPDPERLFQLEVSEPPRNGSSETPRIIDSSRTGIV